MFGISMKPVFAAVVAASIIAFSSPAHAVVIDFANYADANGEASVGEAKAASYDNPLPTDVNVPIAGLLLSATGGVPYLDAFSGGRRAGLGVCGETNGNAQCDPSSDDNVTLGETITISLIGGQSFDFQVTEFRNGGHNDISQSLSTLLVGINGGGLSETDFITEINTTYVDITSITYAYGGTSADQFYISAVDLTPDTEVSEPGAVALFGLGLAGLGYVRRRRVV